MSIRNKYNIATFRQMTVLYYLYRGYNVGQNICSWVLPYDHEITLKKRITLMMMQR